MAASTFKPKEVLREAQEAEKAGNHKVASNLYATISQYLRRKEKFPEALVTIERAIRLSAESARLYLQKALIASALEQGQEAENAMREFSRLTMRKKRVEEYAHYMEEQLADSPSLRGIFYESLLEIERTSSFAFLGLAKALKEQHSFSKAQSILLEALQTKDRRDEVLSLLKEILLQSRRQDALEFVEKYERGDLAHEDLVSLLGNLPAGKKKRKEQTFTSQEMTEEKNLKTLIEELEKELGIKVNEDRDKVEPLVKEFRQRSEAILGKDGRARLDMALAFHEMGLYADALDTLKEIDPNDPHFLSAQGLAACVHLAEGATLQALEVYQSALRNDQLSEEQRKEFLYQTAEIYRKLGDLESALDVLRRLGKIAPEYRDSHKMKIAIQESLGSAGGMELKGKR